MHVYSSDPLSHASMCISMRFPPSFHGYLLGIVSFFFNRKYDVKELNLLYDHLALTIYCMYILHVVVHHRLPLF